MRLKFLESFFFLSLSISFLFPSLYAQETKSLETILIIEHTPVVRFTHGEKLEMRGAVKGEVEWMRFYFRYKDVQQFQVRNMDKGNGFYVYEFDTSVLPELEFEYYLSAKVKDKIINYPADAPSQTVKVFGESREPLPEIPQEFPSPEEEEKKFKLPLSVNGSVQNRISRKEEVEDEKRTTATGNLKVFHSSHREGALSFDFDSNFSYTNTPLEGDKDFDLSNMMLSLSKENHTLKAGDININESEYTVSGLGRRGMEYTFDNQKAYFHIFDVSSQQPKGFKGFGIPKSNISILGGAIGYRFFNDKISLKAIYLTGKDDPSQGVNTGSSPYYQSRKGDVMAIVEETKLFENKLNLKAEFARSKYDGDLTDDVSAQSDNAYNLGAGFNYGGFNIGANYRYTGKNFNPIGMQSFTNNRKGYQASIGITKGILNLTGGFVSEQDNVKDDPKENTTKNEGGNANLSLTFSQKISLSIGYKRGKQKTYQGEVEIMQQDSLTDEYSVTLNLNLSSSANITLSAVNSSLSSKNNPENDTSTFTANLGGAFRAGEIFTLNPTLGYSKATNKFTNAETLTYNSLVTSELAFIPRVFSILFSGSYSRTELAPDNISNIMDLSGGLNFYLDKLIKIGSVIFSLKGSYKESEMAGVKQSDYKIFFQGDFSF